MKKIAIVLLVAAMALSLVACGKFTCDLCKEEKFGKINTTSFLGQEIEYCNSCKDELDELSQNVESGINDLTEKLNDLF